ncbi:MAG TPA: phosphoribosylformylglycinamidine synthase subunit PurL, partial [Thermoanaerobaculia bacterium]|nr:phosphoribosylformylglycinamidine synthase subunit PurL [Thermoanaerobaculia bacterium]
MSARGRSGGAGTLAVPEEPRVTEELARAHGLSEEEYGRLRSALGREPTYTELGITSALWSEHCSYKSSKVYLRELPTEGPHVVQGPGENAGVVDLGGDWVAAFKMESHNHPSYIEPYQGAATGVGGILRDVFTMGARPVAVMDSLFFGKIDAPRMRHLVDGVVRGVGDYGNCVGVPTVGGQTVFHPSYDGNILVNAFALGLARRDRIFHAKATGPGNPILYVGSRTGRDGIHGATMASESFGEESEAKRPTVQVGDPFTEKVLLEACLEAMRSGAIVAIQDMGAAGLTSSAFEMAERGGTGLRLDLDKVPLREEGLGPYEIMLSESQERMLLVARRGREETVAKVFRRWGLEVVAIGEVTAGGRAVLTWGGETVADLPVMAITEQAPVYRRPTAEPADLARRWAPPAVPEVGDAAATLRALLDTPDFGSKQWIWRQYDHTVRTNTVRGPGSDAAVLHLKGTETGIALATDVNPVYCSLDPRTGGAQAVA